MKSFLKVEKDRIAYHKEIKKNSVHRSSLLVPKFEKVISNISFLNHFLLKRNISEVTMKVTAINNNGLDQDSISINIDEIKVYSFNLEELIPDHSNIKEYLIEFFSNKNLFIPFSAVIINHIGKDFINCVHSYNRVLNDIFEDDKINKNHVAEASIDVLINKKYDTFLNFTSGLFEIDDKLGLFFGSNKTIKSVPIKLKKLNNKNYFLSKIFKKNFKDKNKTLKIIQPKQNLFYGRLLAGIIDKKTKAFSANHSYYDSSSTREYFENSFSERSYPYFYNSLNKVTMYPIMSPSLLNVHIEIFDGNKKIVSDIKKIQSPGGNPITFDVDKLINEHKLKDVSLFKLVAKSKNNKIPTRVNHQLIYGEKNSISKLLCSINTSLINKKVFIPKNKKGLTWGQVIVNDKFISKVGICFSSFKISKEHVTIDFYGKSGKVNSYTGIIYPNKSLILDNNFFRKLKINNEFLWFVAKSKSPDLTANSFHYHRKTGNASGEHSF
tara:strand:+ start:146 stop:1630 length:1485 start_codon:yes stop_codon:yes gene_type:complete